MRLYLVIVFLTVLCFVCGQDEEKLEENEDNTENPREMREFKADTWRAVENLPPPGSSGWIPHDSSEETSSQFPKRRRLRKRKRRPPMISMTEHDPDDSSDRVIVRRRLRPLRLEPWEDLEEEIVQRPYVRRRIAPTYEEAEQVVTTTEKLANEVIPEEEKAPDLKTILKKNSGTLSLSELLQQKNLSLAELLKGNQKAISVLTEKQEVVTEVTDVVTETTKTEDVKYKRLPPSIALKKTENRVLAFETPEPLSIKETVEAQRKRLALLNGYKENKVYTDVVTEPITEKRIFVPSHPKLYTSVDYRPELKHFDSITEAFNDITTTSTTEKPKLKQSLPMTNSRLNKLSTTIKPIKISLGELFGLNTEETTEKKKDEPLRMSFELPSLEEKIEETTPLTTEKLKHVTAKEEIMEILEDPDTRERLAKILEVRNMTIEELVEQRERGSSQLHLADIFHNKTREPEPLEDTFVEQTNFKRQQKSLQPPIELIGSVMKLNLKKPTPKVNVQPTEEYSVTSFPTYKIALNKEAFQWPELYPSLFPKIYENNNKKENLVTTEPDLDVQRFEEIENKLSASSNDRFNQKNYQEEEEPQLFPFPTGVKSAIIASFAIVGASLIVFITILLIFKWTQKHRQRLNYCSSFSSRIKSPFLENQPKRTIKTFMNDTLGKKKHDYYNYNKSHIQSMSDEMWENRKPY